MHNHILQDHRGSIVAKNELVPPPLSNRFVFVLEAPNHVLHALHEHLTGSSMLKQEWYSTNQNPPRHRCEPSTVKTCSIVWLRSLSKHWLRVFLFEAWD